MDVETYQAIRAQWVGERADAKDTVKRLTAQIRDLDRTWKKIQGDTDRESDSPRNGTLTAAVSAVLPLLPTEFESPDVWRTVLEMHPTFVDDRGFRANVANVLKRLADEGAIERLQAGSGRNPARYRHPPRPAAPPPPGFSEGGPSA